MKTAELLVDITIVGFLSLLWISGFTFSYILDFSVVQPILISGSPIILAIVLLVIYSFGIVFDYINAAIFTLFKSAEEKKLYKNFSIVKILSQNDKVYPFIENYYGRLRILRSVIISLPLITWSFSCWVFLNHKGIKVSVCFTLVIIILTGIVLFILSIVSYQRRNKDYRKYIAELKSIYLPHAND